MVPRAKDSRNVKEIRRVAKKLNKSGISIESLLGQLAKLVLKERMLKKGISGKLALGLT